MCQSASQAVHVEAGGVLTASVPMSLDLDDFSTLEPQSHVRAPIVMATVVRDCFWEDPRKAAESAGGDSLFPSSWSDVEKSAFFAALNRYSKQLPEWIAQCIPDRTKSVAEVAYVLSVLHRASEACKKSGYVCVLRFHLHRSQWLSFLCILS